MINQAPENLNIEKGAQWWAERTKKTFEKQINKLKDKEKTEQQVTEAELKKIEQEEFSIDKKTEINKKNTPETTESPNTNISTAVKQLNRPEASKWLEQSYTTIQEDIENSDQDKNPIARWLGKLIKRLNP